MVFETKGCLESLITVLEFSFAFMPLFCSAMTYATQLATLNQPTLLQLEEVVRVGRERQQQAVAQCRLATAQEMKAHYLSCLHVMVNSHPSSGNVYLVCGTLSAVLDFFSLTIISLSLIFRAFKFW